MSRLARSRRINSETQESKNTQPKEEAKEPEPESHEDSEATADDSEAKKKESQESELQGDSSIRKNPARRGSGVSGQRLGSRTRSVMQKMHEEQRRNEKKKNRIFEFRVPPGESREIIILDNEPEFTMHEHNVKIDGRFTQIPCVKEWEACPVCQSGDNPYFVLKLTCLVLQDKDGNFFDENKNPITYKNILAIKPTQIEPFIEYQEGKGNGSMRGLHFKMKRPNDPKSARIGDPIYEGLVTEEQLRSEFLLDEPKRNKQGEIYADVDFYLKPYDYNELFPRISADDICEEYAFAPVPGSSRRDSQALHQSDDFYDEDDQDIPE